MSSVFDLLTDDEQQDSLTMPPGLYDWQEPLVRKIVTTVRQYKVCLNLSEMGTGKTIQSVASCVIMRKKPFIICPKSVIPTWQAVCDRYQVKPIAIVNYETLKLGKIYYGASRSNTAYVSKVSGQYQWSLPYDACLIMDEVHKCKNLRTDNGKLLLSVKQCPAVILLSGTIAENISDIKPFLYLCGELNDLSGFNKYKKTHGLSKCRERLQKYIVQIKISQIGSFPKNHVSIGLFDVTPLITQAWQEIDAMLSQKKTTHLLTKIQKRKQQIELHKAQIFVEQTEMYLNENKSVAIFVNYLDTIRVILDALGTSCCIHGDQSEEERQTHISDFQTNKSFVIVCQMRVIGIDLHDTTGRPRATLFSIPESATDLEQGLARTYRAGTLTPVVQTIVVSNDPYEKEMIDSLIAKSNNIGQIHGYDSSYL